MKEKREKDVLTFIIVLILLLFLIPSCMYTQKDDSYAGKKVIFSNLNEFYSYFDNSNESNISKVGGKYVLSGDLIIQPEIILNINNEILEVNCSSDEQYGIYVYGTLNVINRSMITAMNKDKCDYIFWYQKGSGGKIEDSTVEYTWTGKGKADEAGLFVEAEHFEISGSNIRHSKGNGIDFQGKSISIRNSVFQYNGANGIEIFSTNSQAYFEIYNNTISHNGAIKERIDGCGILIDNSGGLTYENTIFENKYCGFESDCRRLDSFCTIKFYNNNVYNNDHDGLFIHENSDVTAYNNIIKNNRRGVSIDNYQTGRKTQLSLYNNTISTNQIGIEITTNYDAYVTITENKIENNKEAMKIQDSNPKIFNNTINSTLS